MVRLGYYILGLSFILSLAAAQGSAAEENAGAERIFRPLPADTIGVVYVADYERLKSAFDGNPVVDIMKKPAFALLRTFLWGKLDATDEMMKANVGVGRDDLLKAFRGPVALAFVPKADGRGVAPMIVADVSNCKADNQALVNEFTARVMAEFTEYKGYNVFSAFGGNQDETLAYVAAGDLFIICLSMQRATEAVDHLTGGGGLGEKVPFLKALHRFDLAQDYVFAYVDAAELFKAAEANGGKADLRLWRAAGFDGAEYFAAGECRVGAGAVTKFFIGIGEWSSILDGIRRSSLKDEEVGRSYPAGSLALIEAAVSPRDILMTLMQGFVRVQAQDMALAVTAALTAYNAFVTQAGGAPTGHLSIALLGNELVGPAGVAGRMTFEGDTAPIDVIQKTLRFLGVPDRDLAQPMVQLPEGRMWLLGRGRHDNPFTLAFLEKGKDLVASPDVTIPPVLATLAPDKSLGADETFRKATVMPDGRKFLILYFSPQVYDVPLRTLGMLVGGFRQKVIERTGGFDPVVALGLAVDLHTWGPLTLIAGCHDDAVEVRIVSPCGVAFPTGAGLLAALLRNIKIDDGLEQGAPAAVVPDLGIAPVIDGNVERLYDDGTAIPLGPANAEQGSKLAMLSSGGKLFISGKLTDANIAKGLAVSITTAPVYSEKGFVLTLTPGKSPATSFNQGNTAWSPRIEYKESTQGGTWSFEAAIPLNDFFIDSQNAEPVWRMKVTSLTPQQGDVPGLSWGSQGVSSGYLLVRALKGPVPPNVNIDAVQRRAKGAGGRTAPTETKPRLPEVDAVF